VRIAFFRTRSKISHRKHQKEMRGAGCGECGMVEKGGAIAHAQAPKEVVAKLESDYRLDLPLRGTLRRRWWARVHM
jgi:hypothetical protein